MDKIRVLFLAASPKVSPLSLDQEIREITTKIRAAEHRDSLEVISRWAVRPDDLQQPDLGLPADDRGDTQPKAVSYV